MVGADVDVPTGMQRDTACLELEPSQSRRGHDDGKRAD